MPRETKTTGNTPVTPGGATLGTREICQHPRNEGKRGAKRNAGLPTRLPSPDDQICPKDREWASCASELMGTTHKRAAAVAALHVALGNAGMRQRGPLSSADASSSWTTQVDDACYSDVLRIKSRDVADRLIACVGG